MELTVVDHPERDRFEARTADGHLAGSVEYTREDGVVVLLHTRVKANYQGMGVGSILARGTLDLLGDSGTTVINECPFIRRFLERHRDDYGWVRHG